MANFVVVNSDTSSIDLAGDLRVYDSIAAAERSIEPHDVRDGATWVCDSKGCLHKPVIETDRRGIDFVRLVVDEQGRDETTRLEELLRQHLIHSGEFPTHVEKMSLKHKLKVAFEFSPNPYA